MNGFLVGAVANNLENGRNTDFYFRADKRTVRINRDTDDYFATERILPSNVWDSDPRQRADEIQKVLAEYGAQVVESGKNGYVVNFQGPREVKNDIKKIGHDPAFRKRPKGYFHVESQPQGSLPLRFPPLSRISDSDSRSVYRRKDRMTVAELMDEVYCSLDIEVAGMESEHPEIYLMSVVTNRENEPNRIFTTLNTGVQEVRTNGQAAIVEQCTDQVQLVGRAAEFIRKVDPLYIFGHNLMDFDLDLSRWAGDFNVASDGENLPDRKGEPKVHGGIPGFTSVRFGAEKNISYKMDVRGRYVIDSLPFSRNNLWLPDNKLETLARYLGFSFQKEFRGEELDGLYERAKRDPKLALKLAKYNLRDTAISADICLFLLPHILRSALTYWTDPTTACFKSNIATKGYEHDYFENLHIFAPDVSVEFDIQNQKFRELSIPAAKTGVYRVRAFYVPLWEEALWDIYTKSKAPTIRYSDDGVARNRIQVITNKLLGATMEEKSLLRLIHDLFAIDKDGPVVNDNTFFGRYGFHKDVAKKAVREKAEQFARVLSQGRIVNAAGDFVFVEDDDKEYPGLLEFGTGEILSIGSGRVRGNINGKRQSIGLNTTRNRTPYESKLWREIDYFVFEDPDYDVLYSRMRGRVAALASVNEGGLDRRKLVYGGKVGTAWSDLSERALKTELGKFVFENQLMPGDSTKRGWLQGRRLVKETDFLTAQEDVDIGKYLEITFGARVSGGIVDISQFDRDIGAALTALFHERSKDLFPDKSGSLKFIKSEELAAATSFSG